MKLTTTLILLYILWLCGCSEQGHNPSAINGGAGTQSRKNLVVIDFGATWCGPCKAMEPIFESVSSDYNYLATFMKIDVDSNAGLAAKHNVRAIPTIIILKNDKEVDRLVGLVSESELSKRILKHQ